MRDLSLHILDIMQNSTAAGAGLIRATFRVKTEIGMLVVTIEDDGSGMDEKLLAVVTDPFTTTRTTRKVGLGIPLFKASAEQSGGSFEIESHRGSGTVVRAEFGVGNIDRPPLGDLAGVIADMAAAWPETDIQLILENGAARFEFSSHEAAGILGEVPLSELAVVRWLREYICDGIKEIFGGVLNEIDS